MSSDVLKPILLRSSTPAPSEKVLLFLEGIERSGGFDNIDSDGRPITMYTNVTDVPPPPNPKDWNPTSPRMTKLPSNNGVYSPVRRESNQTNDVIEDLAGSVVSYVQAHGAHGNQQGADDDADSNVQVGERSDRGRSVRSVAIHSTGAKEYQHEPGPDDEPGPRYESYGSSWGNLGPLPDSMQPPSGWTQPWHSHQPYQTPSRAAGVPLPAETSILSPKSTSYNIAVQEPTDVAQSGAGFSGRSYRSETPGQPRPEQITVSVGLNGTTIHVPNSPTRTTSRVPTEKGNAGEDRPWSPLSGAHTRAPSAKSVAKSRAAGSQYPPLPASKAGSDRTATMSPVARRPTSASKSQSKAPSNAGSGKLEDPYGSRNIHTILEAASKEPSQRNGASAREGSQRAPTSHRGGASEIGGAALGASTYNDPLRSRAASPLSGHRTPTNRPTSPHRRTVGGETPKSPRRALSPTNSHAVHQRHNHPPMNGNGHAGHDPDTTPTQSRAPSPTEELDDRETEIVRDMLQRTPRTSYGPSMLEAELEKSHFHDMDLCVLLHAAEDESQHDIVKKAMRKAVKARIKKLGMKYDKASIQAYRNSVHNHDPTWHNQNPPSGSDSAPAWAKGIMEQLVVMEQRVAALGPKLESLKSARSEAGRTSSHRPRSSRRGPETASHAPEDYEERTPRTQTIPIGTQMTGDESMYRPPETEYTRRGASTLGMTLPGSVHHHDGSTHGPLDEDEFEDDNETHAPNGRTYTNRTPPTQDGDVRARYGRDVMGTDRGDSPGQQYLEEEIYKLRVREPSQSAMTHRSWEIAREGGDEHGEHGVDGSESEMPEIMDNVAGYDDMRKGSPPLPPLPSESRDMVHTTGSHGGNQAWAPDSWNQDPPPPPPWQRIHQRLLNWAIVWPKSELEIALNSTLRGSQVDEVALSIWSTQQYKRYVRQQLTEVPPGRVDRLFVPPNMADAINNAVFHGRHGDACGMLRDLWAPFGLEGMPRIIIVLCKHRSDPNHWVAHKFSLPDGTLSTYDTYPEKCLPDGRPLGWWFAIRIAWPGAMYPSPDHLRQKMVRLHRPMQRGIDNSVAAAGIWRNLLMSSRAERPVDLERLRDLINTEVRNLLQRKEQGKLSIAAPRANWEDMGV